MRENKQSPSISDSWIHLLQRQDPTSHTDKELRSLPQCHCDLPVLDPILAKNDTSWRTKWCYYARQLRATRPLLRWNWNAQNGICLVKPLRKRALLSQTPQKQLPPSPSLSKWIVLIQQGPNRNNTRQSENIPQTIYVQNEQ